VSGGVDSAVTLLRLLTPPHKHKYEVTCALYMRNWDAREEIQHTTTNTTTTGGFTSINNNSLTRTRLLLDRCVTDWEFNFTWLTSQRTLE